MTGVFTCKAAQSRVLDGLPGGPYQARFGFASRDTAQLRQEMLAELLAGEMFQI